MGPGRHFLDDAPRCATIASTMTEFTPSASDAYGVQDYSPQEDKGFKGSPHGGVGLGLRLTR